jgi:hypothetical protein
LPLVVQAQALGLPVYLCVRFFKLAARIFGNVVAACLRHTFQCFQVFRRDGATLFDDHAIGWPKDDIILRLLIHVLTQLRTRFAFSRAGYLQLLLASRFDLVLVVRDAVSGIQDVAFAFLFQAIDALDDLLIQVLLKVQHLLVQAHQFLLARLFVDVRYDV